MRRILTTIILTSLSCFLFAQTFYWTVYDVKIHNGHESEVMAAVDKFMKTDVGKSMPSMSFSSLLFKNSQQKATHRFVFFSQDKSVFGKMYSGMMQQTTDFQLLDATFVRGVTTTGAYLGRSLYATPPASDNNYQAVLELSVKDPAKYLAAFKTFSDGLYAKYEGKVALSLHAYSAGQNPGVTHVAVVGTDSFERYMTFTEEVYETDLFKAFNEEVKDIRKVKSNTATVTLARYNMPEQQ